MSRIDLPFQDMQALNTSCQSYFIYDFKNKASQLTGATEMSAYYRQRFTDAHGVSLSVAEFRPRLKWAESGRYYYQADGHWPIFSRVAPHSSHERAMCYYEPGRRARAPMNRAMIAYTAGHADLSPAPRRNLFTPLEDGVGAYTMRPS